MRKAARSAGLVVALLVTVSCAATTGEQGGREVAAARKREIAALDRALEKEKDDAVIPGLLFKRGHAYLVEAESLRGLRDNEAKTGPGPVESARLLLGALRDFEDIVTNFPQSAEAPEALFHMGVVYDHPNISSFELARNYYNRTIEKYPGTDAARKARIAIDTIEAILRDAEKRLQCAP